MSATVASRTGRFSGLTPGKGEVRDEALRDYDRILYSSEWRRLGGVTQVMSPFDDAQLMHNRLTHSEKVAQVARGIASTLLAKTANHAVMHALGGFDVRVCEAAGMAHDLGHPPFGHIGERVLDRLARDELGIVDGFEGNAQTFRIVAVGRTRSVNYEGFDLTAATLAAIAKYPWTRAEEVRQHDEKVQSDANYRREWLKFSAYTSEEPLLAWARQFAEGKIGGKTQTLEASVMDSADDITYAVHDLEDFYLAGILDVASVHEELEAFKDGPDEDNAFTVLRNRLALDYQDWFDPDLFQNAALIVLAKLRSGYWRQRGGRRFQEAMARTEGTQLIGRYIAGMQLAEGVLWPNGPHVGLSRSHWHEVQILKHITKYFVIERPDVALLQHGQEAVLENLVRLLKTWAEKDAGRLPARLRDNLEIAKKQGSSYIASYYERGGSEQFRDAPRGNPQRAILDYLCALSDAQCLALYYRLSGQQVHRGGLSHGF